MTASVARAEPLRPCEPCEAKPPEAPPLTRAERFRARSGFGLSGIGSMPVDERYPNFAGVRGIVARKLAGPLAAGFALSFQTTGVGGPRNAQPDGYDLWMATPGIALALGAPWTHNLFGIALEGGVALASLRLQPGFSIASPRQPPTSGVRDEYALGYARGTVIVQLDREGRRPFLALSHTVQSRKSDVPHLFTSLEIGLAFDP